MRETVDGLTEAVVRALLRSRPGGGTFHIEDVQDQVELGLMRGGATTRWRAPTCCTASAAHKNAPAIGVQGRAAAPALTVTDNGQRVPLDLGKLQALMESACAGLGAQT